MPCASEPRPCSSFPCLSARCGPCACVAQHTTALARGRRAHAAASIDVGAAAPAALLFTRTRHRAGGA
eukprot:1678529-Prymnesium_polylepis.1